MHNAVNNVHSWWPLCSWISNKMVACLKTYLKGLAKPVSGNIWGKKRRFWIIRLTLKLLDEKLLNDRTFNQFLSMAGWEKNLWQISHTVLVVFYIAMINLPSLTPFLSSFLLCVGDKARSLISMHTLPEALLTQREALAAPAPTKAFLDRAALQGYICTDNSFTLGTNAGLGHRHANKNDKSDKAPRSRRHLAVVKGKSRAVLLREISFSQPWWILLAFTMQLF